MLALRGLARSRLTDSVGRSSSWTSCNDCWMRRRASSVARGARPRFDSIAPSWRSTLARHSRPNHKFGVLMYQCLNSQAPQYLVAAARCLQCRWCQRLRGHLYVRWMTFDIRCNEPVVLLPDTWLHNGMSECTAPKVLPAPEAKIGHNHK